MARGDFGKAFSQHRKEGGVLTRKEFADKWNTEHGRAPAAPSPVEVQESVENC